LGSSYFLSAVSSRGEVDWKAWEGRLEEEFEENQAGILD